MNTYPDVDQRWQNVMALGGASLDDITRYDHAAYDLATLFPFPNSDVVRAARFIAELRLTHKRWWMPQDEAQVEEWAVAVLGDIVLMNGFVLWHDRWVASAKQVWSHDA